jgi:hypothetical protein
MLEVVFTTAVEAVPIRPETVHLNAGLMFVSRNVAASSAVTTVVAEAAAAANPERPARVRVNAKVARPPAPTTNAVMMVVAVAVVPAQAIKNATQVNASSQPIHAVGSPSKGAAMERN